MCEGGECPLVAACELSCSVQVCQQAPGHLCVSLDCRRRRARASVLFVPFGRYSRRPPCLHGPTNVVGHGEVFDMGVRMSLGAFRRWGGTRVRGRVGDTSGFDTQRLTPRRPFSLLVRPRVAWGSIMFAHPRFSPFHESSCFSDNRLWRNEGWVYEAGWESRHGVCPLGRGWIPGCHCWPSGFMQHAGPGAPAPTR